MSDRPTSPKLGHTRGGSKFNQALRAGQYVVASHYGTKKFHILTLRSCAFDDDSRQGKPWEYNPNQYQDYSSLWSGAAVCGNDGSRTTWGSRSYYYWTLRPEGLSAMDKDDGCRACLASWKRLTKEDPSLRIEAASAREVPDELEPPFGWRAVALSGHPYDVAPDGDPEKVLDSAGNVAGVRRTEVKRWQRGPRVVRIVELYGEDADTFEVRVHSTHNVREDQSWSGSWGAMREKAHTIMARGGR